MTRTKVSAKALFAVVGSDEATVKREAAELAKKLTPAEAGDFGLEIIDGSADNVDGAANAIRSTIAALQTLPFFGGKLVWLKSANFISDDVKGKSATVLEALEELATLLQEGLPNDVTFLVSAVDPDKRRSFYKMLAKLAEIQVFDEPDLNRTYYEMALHYGVAVMPARPRKPRDKAKVENAVLFVERWIGAFRSV